MQVPPFVISSPEKRRNQVSKTLGGKVNISGEKRRPIRIGFSFHNEDRPGFRSRLVSIKRFAESGRI